MSDPSSLEMVKNQSLKQFPFSFLSAEDAGSGLGLMLIQVSPKASPGHAELKHRGIA